MYIIPMAVDALKSILLNFSIKFDIKITISGRLLQLDDTFAQSDDPESSIDSPKFELRLTNYWTEEYLCVSVT